MSDPEALVTAADIDKAAATSIVAPVGEGTAPPAAETTDVSATSQTEAPQGEAAPAEPPAPPDWFVKEKSKLQRQRREADRRAERLAAELEALKRERAPTQPRSTDLRPESFPNYDAFIEAKVEAKTSEKIEALNRSRAEQDAHRSAQSLQQTFLEKAHEQAEAADIDMEPVLETLAQAPLLSPTVLEHLASSEHAARLAEWLAENPGELDRVSRLGPALAKKSLAKVEASFGAKPKPSVTNAPPPVPKVGGRTVTQKDWRSSDDMDAYGAAWLKEQEARQN